MSEAARLQRLRAMGIEVWVPRATAPAPAAGLRVRLAAGDGDWLILTDQPLDGEYRRLMGDITACLGPDRCRFGQWTDGAEAGMDVAELGDAGIRHVLVLGSWPGASRDIAAPAVITAADLPSLYHDAAARHALWTALRGTL